MNKKFQKIVVIVVAVVAIGTVPGLVPLLPAVVAREGRPLAGPGGTQRTVQGAATLAVAVALVFAVVLVLVARTGRAEGPRHGEGVAPLALEADHLLLLAIAVL